MNKKQDLNHNHVVHSGWMIKSPPERKLTGPWKIFRARWKRRFFVLMKPAQSLPGTYLLNYYRDEQSKTSRGYIDLEQCAEIIESLDSEQFDHLLAIKTTHKGRDRTYFLATETEEQMTSWVRNLCSVCGMKPDESGEPDSPRPPDREVLPMRTPLADQPVTSLPQCAVGVMTKPPPVSASSSAAAPTRPKHTNTVKPKPTETDRDSEYIPLDTCTSGSQKRANRQISVDSVPDEPAPPPPIKGAGDIDNDVFGGVYDVPPSSSAQDLYDHPPPTASELEEEDIYKVPPPRPISVDNQLDMYDIPPPTRSSPGTARSSSSDSQKADSAYSSQGLQYDYPHQRDTADDIYDIPPSHSVDEVPPSRPPKPGHLQSTHAAQEPYMNLPPNSKAFGEQSKSVDINAVVTPPMSMMAKTELDLYDFPKSCKDSQDNYKNLDPADKLLMATPPPPPSKCGMVDHQYINAAQGTVPVDDEYLSMDPVLGIDSFNKPRESTSTDNECEYTDMTGHSSFEESLEGKQALYDTPPVRMASMAPPRPINKPTTELKDTIAKNARTRSFKRKDASPRVQRKSPTIPAPKSSLAKPSVLLPKRVDNGKHPDFSTSDEDDDDMGSTDVWETTPPAPGNKDTELKYVDLDHDEAADKEPLRSPHGAPGGITPTEYHEIDFVKTDALRNVKESVERSKEKNHT